MYSVGLIGGIASGKSTVAQYFADLGVAVLSADTIAKQLTQPNEPAFLAIIDHFGTNILTHTGELDRRRLRTYLFQDPKERTWLEALLHPLIRQRLQQAHLKNQGPYDIIEIPLLKAKSDYPYLNRILWVQTTQTLERLMARDDCSQEQAQAMIACQVSAEKQRAVADDVLVNDGSINELKKQVTLLHHDYVLRAQSNT